MKGMRFAGVDLAWASHKPSGLALLTYDGSAAEIAQWAVLVPTADIEMWLLDRCRYFGVIAIDAPLIYPEESPAFRECDKAVARAFRKYRISPLPLTRESAARGVAIAQTLSDFGYSPDPDLECRALTRALIEVFPTPALFNLAGTKISYKRGSLKERAAGLAEFQQALLRIFESRTPRVQLNPTVLSLLTWGTSQPPSQGKAQASSVASAEIARLEAILDAVFCAYIALYYWYWGEEKCEVFGDSTTGFIVIPSR